MPNKHNYFTATKYSKIALTAIEYKLTQAQLTSEHGLHATQIKTLKTEGSKKTISDKFTGARCKEIKKQEELIAKLNQEIGELQAQLSWLKKKHTISAIMPL